ncbi:UNKNOWN [Stylonychia lemnae]|uniref:Uncharacterized protein n=1 Tax=Stylonychia lemnae TaxID=5949 RepID=A0A078ARA2_STYLE|nr:UNKNOWN [Stylonychia lemnae]|eukprot:CDW84506.1 UNKNOWN [Stylonychia lemnae]
MNHDEELSNIRGHLNKVISKSELNSINQIMRNDFENKLDRYKMQIQLKIDKEMMSKVSIEQHSYDINTRATRQAFEDLKLKVVDYRRDLLTQQQQDPNQTEFSDKNLGIKKIRQLFDQIDQKYDEQSGKDLEKKIKALNEQIQKLVEDNAILVQEIDNVKTNLRVNSNLKDSSVDTSEMMETVSDLEIDMDHQNNDNYSNVQSSRTPQSKSQNLAEDSKYSNGNNFNPPNQGSSTPQNISSSVVVPSQKQSNGDIENLIQVSNPFSGLLIPSQYQNSNDSKNFEFVPKITLTKYEHNNMTNYSRKSDLKLNQSFQIASNNELDEQIQHQMRTHQKDESDDKITEYVQKSQHQQDLEAISSKLKRKSQYFQTQSTWYNRILRHHQSIQKIVQSKNNLNTEDSTRSNIKMLLNKHGFGDKFLSKLRKIEHVEKRQKIFNQYSQFQLNEVSMNIVEMTHQLEKISDFNLHSNNLIIDVDSSNMSHQSKESGLDKKIQDLHYDFDQLKFIYKLVQVVLINFHYLDQEYQRYIQKAINVNTEPIFEQILNQMEETKMIENELKKTQSQVQELNAIKTAFSVNNYEHDQSDINDTHSIGTFGNFSQMLNKNSSTNLIQSRVLRKSLNRTSQLIISSGSSRPKSNQVSQRNFGKMSITPQNGRREGTINEANGKMRRPVYQHINLNVDGPQYLNNTMIDHKLLMKYINSDSTPINKSEVIVSQDVQGTKLGHLELKRFENLQEVLKDDRTVKPLDEISFVQFNNLSLQKVISPDSVSRIIKQKRPKTSINLVDNQKNNEN